MADLLEDGGDLHGAAHLLCVLADADDAHTYTAWRVADLLARRGDLDALHARADAADWDAATRLAEVLIKQGRGEEAERLLRFGLNPDGSIASALRDVLP